MEKELVGPGIEGHYFDILDDLDNMFGSTRRNIPGYSTQRHGRNSNLGCGKGLANVGFFSIAEDYPDVCVSPINVCESHGIHMDFTGAPMNWDHNSYDYYLFEYFGIDTYNPDLEF